MKKSAVRAAGACCSCSADSSCIPTSSRECAQAHVAPRRHWHTSGKDAQKRCLRRTVLEAAPCTIASVHDADASSVDQSAGTRCPPGPWLEINVQYEYFSAAHVRNSLSSCAKQQMASPRQLRRLHRRVLNFAGWYEISSLLCAKTHKSPALHEEPELILWHGASQYSSLPEVGVSTGARLC